MYRISKYIFITAENSLTKSETIDFVNQNHQRTKYKLLQVIGAVYQVLLLKTVEKKETRNGMGVRSVKTGSAKIL